MRRLFLLLWLPLALFAATTSQILSTDGKSAKIESVTLPVGTSGIVVHSYDEAHRTIVARAILVAPDTIRFELFDALAQDALPKPLTKPQKGDKVILGYLYERALIIAPNLKTYQSIAALAKEKLLHPDLFAAELAKRAHKMPDRKDFKDFCNRYALAKLYIAQKSGTDVVDCYSFKKVGSLDVSASGKETKLPFYNRFRRIPGSLFDFFGSDEENYFDYYKKLER